MDLPKLSDLDIENKKVLVRLDLDVPDDDDSRLLASLETLVYLAEKSAKIVVIGHRGRPSHKASDGKPSNGDLEKYSLKPVAEQLEKLLEEKLGSEKMKTLDMHVAENLRFDHREEANDASFAAYLSRGQDLFVNDAFAASHNSHASIVGIPKFLPTVFGFRFIKEIEQLSKVREHPERPVVAIISGVKENKLEYISGFEKFSDKVLVGGRLPDYVDDSKLTSVRSQTGKTIYADLNFDKEDISLNSVEVFEKEVAKAKTIILAGPLGKFEDEGHLQGTERVFGAVANSGAFKVAGGGETEAALKVLNLTDKFDWISTGGGAMLEFLSSGTLAAIEAIDLR